MLCYVVLTPGTQIAEMESYIDSPMRCSSPSRSLDRLTGAPWSQIGVANWVDKMYREGSIEQADEHGRTGLLHTVLHGLYDLSADLLAMGADPHHADNQGVTPMMAAAFNGYPKLIMLLHKHAASPTASDAKGWTPMMQAAFSGHADCIDALAAAISAGTRKLFSDHM